MGAKTKIQKIKNYAIFILCVLLCAALTQAKQQQEPFNFLFLTIDSLRPDMMGCFGCPGSATPFLDQLSKRGQIFTQAISPSAWTSPAILSLLTGLYPETHGVHDNAHAISELIPDLPYLLKNKGYHVPSLSYMLSIPNYRNLDFESNPIDDVSSNQGQGLLRWATQAPRKPFFAWYHFLGPHIPYKFKTPLKNMYIQKEYSTILAEARFAAIQSRGVIIDGEYEWQPGDQYLVRLLYKANLREFDALLKNIFIQLAQAGILGNTVVVITSDHGECLLEHNKIGHPSTNWNTLPYESLLHVPLIIILPSIPKPRLVAAQIQTIDIMPTILELAEVSIPHGCEGKSLMPLIRGTQQNPTHPVSFATSTACGYQCFDALDASLWSVVRTPEALFIANNELKKHFAYDLATDPAGIRPISLSEKQLRRFYKELAQVQKQCRKHSDTVTNGQGAVSLIDPIPNSLQLYYRGIYYMVHGDTEHAKVLMNQSIETFWREGHPIEKVIEAENYIKALQTEW